MAPGGLYATHATVDGLDQPHLDTAVIRMILAFICAGLNTNAGWRSLRPRRSTELGANLWIRPYWGRSRHLAPPRFFRGEIGGGFIHFVPGRSLGNGVEIDAPTPSCPYGGPGGRRRVRQGQLRPAQGETSFPTGGFLLRCGGAYFSWARAYQIIWEKDGPPTTRGRTAAQINREALGG